MIDEQLTPELKGKSNIVYTSLNRYERKKNIPLAIKAFHKYLQDEKEYRNEILVIAGGYDPRVAENVEHYDELQKLTKDYALVGRVVFLKSISNQHRLELLKKTAILMYTPANEHFGIVPVEAMFMGCAVIACNSGGPLESIEDKVTGLLLPPEADTWATGLSQLKGTNLDLMRAAGR